MANIKLFVCACKLERCLLRRKNKYFEDKAVSIEFLVLAVLFSEFLS